MASNPLVPSKFIYQYGNVPNDCYIFYKGGFEKITNKSLKEQVTDASYIDGEIDNALTEQIRKGANLYEINFNKQINDAWTNDFIEKIFDGRSDYAFFFSTDDTDTVTSGYKTTQRNIDKWYFSRLRTIVPPTIRETERDNLAEAEVPMTTVMKAYQPYFYEALDQLEYVDYTTYVGNTEVWDSVGTTTTWAASGQYWLYPTGSFGNVSDLSDADARTYFMTLGATAGSRKYFLQMRDRFFDRDITQTNRNYLLDTTYNASTQTDTVLSAGMSDVNSNASEYRLEITSMTQDQTLTLNNLSNNSGLKITWTDSTASADLVFNSIYAKLYEGASETEVPATNYTVEIIGNEPLYLTGLHNPYAIATISNETIRVVVGAGSNLTIKMDVLYAYV